MTDQAPATREQTCKNAQRHILKASKFQIDGTPAPRNWSLFFFFRILPQAEFDAMIGRMEDATSGDAKIDREVAKRNLWLDFRNPALLNAGLVTQRLEDPPAGDAPPPERKPDEPAKPFLNWLKAIVSADNAGISDTASAVLKASGFKTGPFPPSKETIPFQGPKPTNIDWKDPVQWIQQQFKLETLDIDFLQQLINAYIQEPKKFADTLQLLRQQVVTGVPDPLLGPLSHVTLYEILRQCAPAMMNPEDSREPSPGIVRGEDAGDPNAPVSDHTPINIAFTYSGLNALKLNPTTLRSFPEAFKQGMAARAERLHDTGPSAPDFWEGELGLSSVHGYFTGGFVLKDGKAATEAFWKAMRRDVAAFNAPMNDHGRMLRFGFRVLFRLFGLEILHIELGQYPYDVKDDDAIEELKDRIEHFGFIDGLSQPFVDMGLGDTPPGGGTPSRDSSWSPVAPGEIFLNMPDENGEVQLLPVNESLTLGSTFLVFRKLEQDVAGFRGFLSRMRPKDKEAQTALSAQFVGRWPNGMPLVLSPDQERAVNEKTKAKLNDFRYAVNDPLGKKCPLGAHIRRTNPRDIGGRGEARHHRILRRGISYGGPRLKDDALDDGEKRGLLFIAANSRIDLQFEVVQSNWINSGEFLGQAGLGRCPLTGDHGGALSDSFLAADASAPITGLPRFVTTRGGDYFFAPGIDALRKIADGNRFDPERIPSAGFSMGDATTPVLLSPDRLERYTKTILGPGDNAAIHIELPASKTPTSPTSPPDKICFIGRHGHVKTVLSNPVASPGQLAFSVRQYTLNGQNATRGGDLVIGTEDVGPTEPARKRLQSILYRAWARLGQAHDPNRKPDEVLPEIVRAKAKSALDRSLRRTAQERRIDLITDLSTPAAYAVIARLYGIPAPEWLTELAASLRFARQHVSELPPEWIMKLIVPDNPGVATLQTWSAIILADLIGNVQSIGALHALARQAGSEMLNYIDTVVSKARISPDDSPMRSPKTLLGAFIDNESRVQAEYPPGSNWQSLYYRDVGTLLLEIVGTTLVTIPLAFASVMGALLKFRIDLPTLMQMPGIDLSRIIYEADRLNPTIGLRVRYCETKTTLPNGPEIEAGEWVAALIGAANLDPRVFREPFRFSLDPNIRKIDDYLLFNEKGPRECWGRDRVAMVVLEECIRAASRLQGLRRIAGERGEPKKLVGITISLPACFTHVDGKPPPQTTVRDMSQATTSD